MEKTMKVYEEGVSWLDPDTKTPLPKDGEHFDAGYIRVYMNGSTEGRYKPRCRTGSNGRNRGCGDQR